MYLYNTPDCLYLINNEQSGSFKRILCPNIYYFKIYQLINIFRLISKSYQYILVFINTLFIYIYLNSILYK